MFSRNRFCAHYKDYGEGDLEGDLNVPRSTATSRRKRIRQQDDISSDSESDCTSDVAAQEGVSNEMEPPAASLPTASPAELEYDQEIDVLDEFIDIFWNADDAVKTREDDMTPEEEAFLLDVLEKWRAFGSTKERLAADLESAYLMMVRLAGGKTTAFPRSIYLLEKMYLKSAGRGITMHYMCKTHGCVVGRLESGQRSDVEFDCSGNQTEPHVVPLQDLHQNSMLTISVEDGIRELLRTRHEEITEGLRARNSPDGPRVPAHEFIQSGYYRHLVKKGKLRPRDLTLKIHIDGAEVTKSSNLKAYLVHFTLAELRATSEASSGLLHTVWIGDSKDMPDRRILLEPFLQEMKDLSTTGMEWVVEGRQSRIRVYVTCCVADAMERIPLVGLSSIHACNGCDKCDMETELFKNPEKDRSYWKVFTWEKFQVANSRKDADFYKLGKQLMNFEPDIRMEIRKDPKFKSLWELSVLASLKQFHLVSSLPPEPMHLLRRLQP